MSISSICFEEKIHDIWLSTTTKARISTKKGMQQYLNSAKTFDDKTDWLTEEGQNILKRKSLATHYRYAYLLQKSMLKLTQT